jgi:formylglycine-generating enzyme required for sulfatase activity
MKIKEGSYRVIRGGSWYYIDYFCEGSVRGSEYPYGRYHGVGFRVARRRGDENK